MPMKNLSNPSSISSQAKHRFGFWDSVSRRFEEFPNGLDINKNTNCDRIGLDTNQYHSGRNVVRDVPEYGIDRAGKPRKALRNPLDFKLVLYRDWPNSATD